MLRRKVKVKLWPTKMPYKNNRIDHHGTAHQYDHNDFVLAVNADDAAKFMALRNCGERLVGPEEHMQGYPYYRHMVTRTGPKTLSKQLRSRMAQNAKFCTISNGQLTARFIELGVSSGVLPINQAFFLTRDILTFGCWDSAIVDEIARIEKLIPGHTMEYAINERTV